MEFFRSLADMRPDMRKGHVLLAELIAAGEIPVGLTVYNGNAESFKRKGAPIDWVAVRPLVARPQGIGIARSAPHAAAARAFVDFVLSPEGQQLYASLGRSPVSTKVATPMSRFEYTLVDPAAVLDEQDKWTREWDKLFNQK
jgi:iron(III) transport system substrate-binding protein